MAKPKGYISFKITISPTSKLYYTANIFKNLADMRAFAVKNGGGAASYYRDAYGACSYWPYDTLNPPKTDKIGVISLWEGALGGEIVSHECVHAALGALSRKGIPNLETGDIGSYNAEELCYITGYLVRQIYEKLSKLRIMSH